MTQRVEGQELKGSEPARPAVKPQRCSCYLGTGSLDPPTHSVGKSLSGAVKWVAFHGYLKHIGLDFPWKTEGSPEAGGPIGRHQEDFPMARCPRGNKVPQELYLSLGRVDCSEAGDGWDKF